MVDTNTPWQYSGGLRHPQTPSRHPPDNLKTPSDTLPTPSKYPYCQYIITNLIQLFSNHMTSIPPQTSARHPTASIRHPQTLSRHYPDTPNIAVFAYERALEEKAIAESDKYYSTVCNLFDIYITPRHLPDTLRHHPDTLDVIQPPKI